jgi:hypothetical protein
MPKESTGLSPQELVIFTDFLRRIKNTQIRGQAWKELAKKIPFVPIELIITDAFNRVFMIYRDDGEFKGWHIPGSVWNDWETIPDRRKALVAGEVIKDAGLTISDPVPIGWLGVYRGDGPDNSLTRNSCALMHLAHVIGEPTMREGYGFFPLDHLPEDTLSHHKYMLRRFKQYLVDGAFLVD